MSSKYLHTFSSGSWRSPPSRRRLLFSPWVPRAQGVFAMIDVQLKTTDPETVAFISMQGPYEQIPEAMGRLYGWVGQHGMQPVGMPAGVYLHRPDARPGEALRGSSARRWRTTCPTRQSTRRAAESSTSTRIWWPSRCTAGPTRRSRRRTASSSAWIEANGFDVVGPPEELYFSDPETTAPSDYLTEIRFPVAKK